MNTAIYPGSFDPVTVGHLHIAERACHLFDRVVIGVAELNYKSAWFSLDERVAFIQDAISHLPNCEIAVYDTLTVDLAKKYSANIIIRGLRAVSDYEYEMQVAAINKFLDDSVETVFLMANSDYSFISSTMIKQVSDAGGQITGLVTDMVEKALKARLIHEKTIRA